MVVVEVLFCSELSKCVKWQVTQVDLHRYFHALGAGVIEDVRIQHDKGFGFVRYSDHSEAALAIQMGNGRIFCGKPIKVKFGLFGKLTQNSKAHLLRYMSGFG